jgi:hypothetical protein
MPWTVIFLEDLGVGEKGIAEMLAPVLIRRLTFVLFSSKYHLGPLWFHGGHRSLDGRPQNPSLGGRLWPWFPRELRIVCLPVISLADGASFLWGHSLLKWPSCPHWKHVCGSGPCPGETSWSAVIRASCCLSFLFFLFHVFLFFF